jgi:hypothetical protein
MAADLGSLIGVLVGGTLACAGGVATQLLQGQREHRRWIAENRRDECRELLGALATEYIMAFRHQNLSPSESLTEEDKKILNATLHIFETRIFVADEIQRGDLYQRWQVARVTFNDTGKFQPFETEYHAVRNAIITFAKRPA